MGAVYMAETGVGPTVEVAYQQVIAEITSRCYDWDDPASKGGDTKWTWAWPAPVHDCAIDWMRGWVRDNPPDGIDPDDKWGPWLVFPLTSGGWHFFGWVNT